MFYAAWLLGGLLLGLLVRDLRRAVLLMVLVVVLVLAAALVAGRSAYPLVDSGGLLVLPLVGILATIAGHRISRAIWGFFAR